MRKILLLFLLSLITIQLPIHSAAQKRVSGKLKTCKTKTGKTILISETHPAGQRLGSVHVATLDFKQHFSKTFKNVDPISEIFVADLDEDGFDEIYIITTSSGTGCYGKVMGFASNGDCSISVINCKGHTKNKPIFKGYMGHDIFTVEDRKLIRTFPVYKKGDPHGKPTGGKRKVVYKLYWKRGIGYLKIETSETINPS